MASWTLKPSRAQSQTETPSPTNPNTTTTPDPETLTTLKQLNPKPPQIPKPLRTRIIRPLVEPSERSLNFRVFFYNDPLAVAVFHVQPVGLERDTA